VTIAELRQRREDIVREHMESENRHEFDATMRTFAHPRYELIATGEVFDGADEVARYYATSRDLPDQRNEVHALYHAADAVIVEFDPEPTAVPLRASHRPAASSAAA
jgi:hypothetical protein